MAGLFPEGYEDEVVTEEEIADETETGYREGIYFDSESMDFVRDGQYRTKGATGVESWVQWCTNCLLTERGAYPCYGDTFGIATIEAFQAETRALTQSILTREICESLVNDPYGRTQYVSNVEFEWIDSDALNVTATVVGIDATTIDIITTIDTRAR